MSKGKRKKQKVCLYGHFGGGNFGNESTLQAMLYHLRRVMPNSEVTCICTAPEIVAANYHITAVPINAPVVKAWNPRNRFARVARKLFIGVPIELYRWLHGFIVLRGTEVLIVPGTGLLTDAYGLRSWGPYNIFKWSAIAKILGCKLLIVSVGAGPIYSRLGRFFVKSVLAMANFRSYRDEASLQYLKSIGFTATDDQVCPDLAFSLPEHRVTYGSIRTRRRSVVGLGVMLYAGKYSVEKPKATTYRNYLDNLTVLATWLLAHGYDVRLLVGDLCDLHATREFKCLLIERLPNYDAERILDDEPSSVEQLLSHLAETDFVIATRFHNVLLAMLCSKPVIAISFHHKVASLMSAMGMSEYCVDINDFGSTDLIAKVLDVQNNADTLTSLIRSHVESCRSVLAEQYQRICEEADQGSGRE